LPEIEFVDIVAAVALGLAASRGLLIGLTREAFSLLSIAAAYLAIRYSIDPAGALLNKLTGNAIPGGLAPWIVGSVIFFFTITVISKVGRRVRASVREAGLGMMDRIGGGVLGAAEGVLVIALVFSAAANFMGRDHPNLADTYTLQAIEQLEQTFKD
jgi:uncharacterized membrane protein required for colicin V production